MLFRLIGLLALGSAALGAPAWAEKRITPYIEVQQVLDADFNNGGDVLTYTSVAAGVEASVRERRVEATIGYRYERRIPYEDDLGDEDVHSGIARARLELAPDLLSLEGGAIATRARGDIRGAAPIFLTGNRDNITQVYGFYGGPTLSTQVGPLFLGASYQLGYVKVEDRNPFRLPPGQPRLDLFDEATSHKADASIGMESGTLPFGWTISGGYQREDASQLDQRFEASYVRLDITQPVSPTVALTAGVGHEDIEVSERAPLRNPDGTPVLDGGRFVTDPASPRLLSYDQRGLIYDAGVIWRPSRRTTLQVRAGRRYGAFALTGSFDHQINRYSGMQVGVYNGIQSFGRSLTGSLAGLPTSFDISRNPLTGDFSGCVFGTNPGTGGCLDDTFQSISTSNFRSRGVNILYSAARGPWRVGIGGGYAQRKYLAPTGTFFTVNGVTDESWMLQADASLRLSRVSGIDGSLFANWYRSGIAGAPDVTAAGGTSSYYHSLTERLTGRASVGLYTFDIDGFESDVTGQLLLGLRYQL
jgi:hypothetical protein